MILVIFEFIVLENKEKDYFKEVEKLQLELKQTKGFISVDRFIHNFKKNNYVSISTWKNEDAVKIGKKTRSILYLKIKVKKRFLNLLE